MIKKIFYIFSFFVFFYLFNFLLATQANATYVFKAHATDSNSGTQWQVIYNFEFVESGNNIFHESSVYKDWSPFTNTPYGTTKGVKVNSDYIHWSTSCKDPRETGSVQDYDNETHTFTLAYNINVTYTGGNGGNNLGNVSWNGDVTRQNGKLAFVNASCPADCSPRSCGSFCGTISDGCGGTKNCGSCGNDYCGGASNCTLVNRFCNSSNHCDSNTTAHSSSCGSGNNCAPEPPSGRTETLYCQGPAGTDRASVIRFNWDPVDYERSADPYDLEYRKASDGSDDQTIPGIETSYYQTPGSSCNSGPGGCSFPYGVDYEWRVRGHVDSAHAGPTDWSTWAHVTTRDCSGKADLHITAFTFPGGSVDNTSDATVTVENQGDNGTSGSFDVKVVNGDGTTKTVTTSSLAAGGSRTVTLTGIARPTDAGDYTATATVDSGNDIDEASESNNTKTDAYTTTAHISGHVWVDYDEDGTQDAGEPDYQGAKVRINSVNYSTNSNGDYTSAQLTAATYTVAILTIPNYTNTTAKSVGRNLGPDKTANFGINTNSSVLNVHVFTDSSGDGIQQSIADGDAFDEADYSGARVTVTGANAGTYTTDSNGDVVLSGAGTSSITLADPPPPAGWTVTTTNPRNNVTVPPGGQEISFGVQPPSPTCAGGLTTSKSSVKPGPGITATLTCVNPTSPTGAALEYKWDTTDDVGGTISPSASPAPANHTATWTSPSSSGSPAAHPSMQICYQGTFTCSSYSVTINFQTFYSISGAVYVDDDKDGFKNEGAGEKNYQSTITIAPNPVNGSTVSYSPSNITGDNYTIDDLPAGTYNVSFTNLPSGFSIIYPNGVPPTFTVTVGGSCSVNGAHDAACSGGNITNLDFGINNALPWIQTGGSDIWINNGFDNPIPTGAVCNGRPAYTSINVNNTPGVVFSGSGTATYGTGGSGQASANGFNWQVGGLSYPEPYTPPTPGIIKTSYTYVTALAAKNGVTPGNLASYCGAGGIGNCQLSGSIPHGIYQVTGDLHLTTANYTFPANSDFVILVQGNLYLQGQVHVPVGSTALFSVGTADDGTGGDIHVDPSVGAAAITDYASFQIEGWYSADVNFYVDGAAACPTADKRLNVAGAIVVNANLNDGGQFINSRDLCSGNASCPAFFIQERPDFTLNAPALLQYAPRIWQEIAP